MLFAPGSDEEMDKLAEAEEEEALALQKQMAASFEEQDFDADIFEVRVYSAVVFVYVACVVNVLVKFFVIRAV